MLKKYRYIIIALVIQSIATYASISNLGTLNQILTQLKKRAPEIPEPAIFAQTDAHRSIDILNQQIQEKFGNSSSWGFWGNTLSKYKDLIDKIVNKERKYKQTHFAFYHAQSPSLRVFQDFNKELCKLQGKCKGAKDYIPLRGFTDNYYGLPNINSWMDSKAHLLKIKGPFVTSFNNQPDVQPYLLAINLALFGNMGRHDSNTFYFFLIAHSSVVPSSDKLLDFILSALIKNSTKKQEISNKILPKIKDLVSTIKTQVNVGNIIQILIPKNMVDEVVYLSKLRGYYWDFKMPGLTSINSYWDDTKKRYTAISPILELYQKDPKKLNINLSASGDPAAADIIDTNPPPQIVLDRMEARIYLKGEIFGKPSDKIKMYQYWVINPANEAAYKAKIKSLAQEAWAIANS